MPADKVRRPAPRTQVQPLGAGIADAATSRAMTALEQLVADLQRRVTKLENP